jgi:hypothetical protein
MSTLNVSQLKNASAASPAIVLAADGSATAQLSSINGGPISGTRNRIINGDMRIDQRNNGAAVTVSGANPSLFCVDRWAGRQEASSGAFTLQQSTVAPTGFVNSLVATVTTADTSLTSNEGYSIYQAIEGFNSADLDWGTANAQFVTVSFWVRSSVTGSFSFMLLNDAFGRNYGALYTINSANAWEYKTVVVPGDTSGTWLTNSNAGIRVGFGLGAGINRTVSAGWSSPAVLNTKSKVTGGLDWIGTNGATFYITGVQLEPGTVATPFERRSFGQELALCMRYLERSYDNGVVPGTVTANGQVAEATFGDASGFHSSSFLYTVPKRAAATVNIWSPSVANTSNAYVYAGPYVGGANAALGWNTQKGFQLVTNTYAPSAGSARVFHFVASAEL